jgi:hypothetical protein
MARSVVVASVCALALAALACARDADESTACGRAREMLGECGVIMPIAETAECTGTYEAISTCVLTTDGSCDALAALASHLDQCTSAEGGAPLPSDFPGVGTGDAGAVDARADAVRPDPTNALPEAGDAPDSGPDASPSVDASTDSGAVFVLDESDTVGAGEERSYATPRLSAGNYDFRATISGAADVYVRKGFVPTTKTYDCALASAADVCAMPVASSAILYVLVHGQASSTSFEVTAVAE